MAHRRSGISQGNADLRIRTKYLGPKRDRASDARRRLAQSDCRSRNSSARQTGRLSGSAAVKIEIFPDAASAAREADVFVAAVSRATFATRGTFIYDYGTV